MECFVLFTLQHCEDSNLLHSYSFFFNSSQSKTVKGKLLFPFYELFFKIRNTFHNKNNLSI